MLRLLKTHIYIYIYVFLGKNYSELKPALDYSARGNILFSFAFSYFHDKITPPPLPSYCRGGGAGGGISYHNLFIIFFFFVSAASPPFSFRNCLIIYKYIIAPNEIRKVQTGRLRAPKFDGLMSVMHMNGEICQVAMTRRTAVREIGVSRHHVDLIKAPLKPFEHHSTMV